jgi:nicotinate-nucleotide adenylyltransferase
MLRLGVYGGAFDPPHLAHHALAQAAIQQYQLDRLHIIPTGHAWHKSRTLSPAQHRLAMARLAFEEMTQVVIDPRETQRSGPSYTADTLQELRSEYAQAELFLIMGQDQLEFFPQWHRHAEILQIATLLVAFRADSMPTNSPKSPPKPSTITYPPISYQPIALPAMPHSATQIRQLVAQGQAVSHLVKPAVARYIGEHQLYSSL